MKLIKSILTISLILILQGCLTVTNEYEPNKRLIKRHIENIESYTQLKLSKNFEVLFYHYFDNIEEFSIEFKLKYSETEFNDYKKQLDNLKGLSIENSESLNSSWIINNENYSYNAYNSHMDQIDITVKCDSNIIQYYYAIE